MKNFEVRTNMADADFWIVRRGAIDKVGSVTKIFNAENIGVKIINTALLDHRYMAYKMEYLHSTGYYQKIAKGLLRLQNITTKDVEFALTIS